MMLELLRFHEEVWSMTEQSSRVIDTSAFIWFDRCFFFVFVILKRAEETNRKSQMPCF